MSYAVLHDKFRVNTIDNKTVKQRKHPDSLKQQFKTLINNNLKPLKY